MSTIAVNAITDASGGNTASINGATPTTDNLMGRNRIINGDMRIDQRNDGAAVTLGSGYSVDRWISEEDSDGAATAQQVSDAPVGFVNSIKWTTTTADASLGATQYATIRQHIEGYNIADLEWGTANAKTVTLSFWVRSSLTGTFGGSLRNNGGSRSYPFTYSISTADTWEQKSITVAGDTTGTWLTTTGRGLTIDFGLGVGSTYSGTAGSWSSGNYISVTGATSVIGTLNATWYITGVQLEAGSVATSFERRHYGQELALCQRYYQNVVLPNGAYFYAISSAQYRRYTVSFLQEMRSAPTCTATGVTGNSSGPTVGNVSTSSTTVAADGASGTTLVSWTSAGNVTASAEL